MAASRRSPGTLEAAAAALQRLFVNAERGDERRHRVHPRRGRVRAPGPDDDPPKPVDGVFAEAGALAVHAHERLERSGQGRHERRTEIRMRIELPNHGEEEGVCGLYLFRPHVRQPSDRASDFANGAAEVDLARLDERLEGGLELLSVAVGWQRLSLERLRDRLGGFGSSLERGQKTEEIGDDLAPLVAAERPDGAILRLRIGRARELEQDPNVFREPRAQQVDGRRVQAVGQIDPAVFGRQDGLLRECGRDRAPAGLPGRGGPLDSASRRPLDLARGGPRQARSWAAASTPASSTAAVRDGGITSALNTPASAPSDPSGTRS